MTLDERRGLGLLLALTSSGCLGLPRYIENDGDGDGDDDVNDDVSDVDVDDGTTTRPHDDGPVESDAMSVDGAASFLFMPDVGTETVTTTVSDITTDPPPPPESYACQAYSSVVGMCYGERYGQSSYGYCLEYLAYVEQYSPECVPSFDEFLVCLSMLSCEEFGAFELCQREYQKFEECTIGG